MRAARAYAAFLRLALLGMVCACLPAHSLAAELELHVALDPASRELRARAELAPATPEFRFALHESLQMRAASADGKSVRIHAAGRDGAVRGWRVALPANTRKLRLEYGGILPVLDRSLDHRGVLRGLPPMASAEGSFLPAGSAWYPQPAPLFSYRLTLSVPAGQRALVPGHLASEQTPADGTGFYRATFEFPHPADGIDLMAGPWVVREKMVPREEGAVPLRLRTYFTRELDALPGLADAYLEDTQRYLDLYAERIGAYPFTGFSIVASPLPTGFGMPTLTYLGADVLKLPFIRATSLGHEVLHNWWGNGVTVDHESGNWSEGLTTFMADYAYKERESAEAARAMRLAWLRDFAATPPQDRRPLRDFRSRAHGAEAATGYGKAAMLFLMLRDAFGEPAFDSGIRVFWQRHRFKKAGWDDLRHAFEQASGKDLDGFFRQWLERAGGPAVAVRSATLKNDAGKLQLQLALEQAAPPYALRLPIELLYADRSEMRHIGIAQARELISMDVASAPGGLRIDPDLRVWRMLEPDQLPPILRQWFLARSPRVAVASPSVRAAAEALAGRLFEAPPRSVPLEHAATGADATLLIGLHADIDAALARAGWPPRPRQLTAGSAQVWTVMPGAGRAPLAVVSARDAEALRALLRPLPHYGAQSWLAFDGSRVTQRGVWPAPGQVIGIRQAP